LESSATRKRKKREKKGKGRRLLHLPHVTREFFLSLVWRKKRRREINKKRVMKDILQLAGKQGTLLSRRTNAQIEMEVEYPPYRRKKKRGTARGLTEGKVDPLGKWGRGGGEKGALDFSRAPGKEKTAPIRCPQKEKKAKQGRWGYAS